MFSKIIPLVVGLAIGSYTLYSLIRNNDNNNSDDNSNNSSSIDNNNIENQNNNQENNNSNSYNSNSSSSNNNSLIKNSGDNNKDIDFNNGSTHCDIKNNNINNNNNNNNNDDNSNNSNNNSNSGKNNINQVESTEKDGDKSKNDDEDEKEDDEDNNTLPEVKNVLFAQEKFSQLIDWSFVTGIGGGLDNMGNTCYMNSVLQCLCYSPIFAQYLISTEHGKNCNTKGFCVFCEIEVVAVTCHLSTGYSNAPRNIAGDIKKVAPNFKLGQQEDAHEFMVLLLDSLQKICLSKYPKGSIAERDSMTTVVGSIFGGYLRSQIKCSECPKQPSRFDSYMNLSLDVNQVQSLVGALDKFVTPETLDGSNGYKCSKCKKIVRASKEFRIQIAPPILAIQFNLFSGDGTKIDKKIYFGKSLDLSPFMTEENDHSMYDLYAVLNHVGSTANSGHYYCYVKGTDGFWYKMNDSSVSGVKLKTVLQSKAYMVFYSKRNTCDSINTNTIEGQDQGQKDEDQ